MDNFIGLNGFVWFLGVVEDRQDPYQIGRVRVRCFGHHTGDKSKLPTADLPWAQVMLPVTSAGISGVGQTPTGLVEGSHVFGFFRDGEARQEPVVMGSMPGYPMELGDITKGFYSPVKVSDEKDNVSWYADKSPQKDSDSNYPRWRDSPDTNQLATGKAKFPEFKDYSFNYKYSEHSSITDILKNSSDVGIIGIANADITPIASAFIDKGSSSLFGFITDMVTQFVTPILGNALFDAVGGVLGEFNRVIGNSLDKITKPGREIFKEIVGLADKPFTQLLEDSTIEQVISPDGVFNAEILLKNTTIETFGVLDKMTAAGFELVTGVNPNKGVPDGFLKFNVSNIQLAKDLFGAENVTSNVDAFNESTKLAVTKGANHITKKALGEAVRLAKPVTDVINDQSDVVQKGEKLLGLKQTSGTDKILTTKNKDGVIVAVAEDEYQSGDKRGSGGSHTQNKDVATVTKGGRKTLMSETNSVAIQGGETLGWKLPVIPEPQAPYPRRHIFETECGHHKLYDDNKGFETIREYHASGTYWEIANDGHKNEYIISNQATIVEGNSFEYVRGAQITKDEDGKTITQGKTLSCDGHYKVLINKSKQRNNDYEIVIGENANVTIQCDKGDINLHAKDGSINMTASEEINMLAGKDIAIKSSQDVTVNADDDIILKAGDKIRLN